MTISDFNRGAFGVFVAVAILAGCGGSQTGSGVLPQNVIARVNGAHRGSWMKPGASNGDLLYVSDGLNAVRVLSYPQGTVVGTLTGVARPEGQCSDSDGNVFISDRRTGELFEYAHGGTSPINMLNAQGWALNCSFDPATENLAVPVGDAIEVFHDEQGSPTIYTDSDFARFNWCAYDNKSNLLCDGTGSESPSFVELKAGSSTFTNITLSENVDYLGDIQWDGSYFAIDDFGKQARRINRVEVSGSTGMIVGSTDLSGARIEGYESWIQDGTVVVPVYLGRPAEDDDIYFWSYPSGGKPAKELPHSDFHPDRPIMGLSISVASSDLRIRR